MDGIKRFVSGAALALVLAGTGVSAQEQGPAAPAARLTQPPARDMSELQVLFWTDAQRAERFRAMEQWFAGHEVPAAPVTRPLPKGAPLSDALQVELKALMAATNTAGVMVLEDGAVWRQIDAESPFNAPRAGSSVKIRRAALGSFFLNIDGQTAIRAQRSR